MYKITERNVNFRRFAAMIERAESVKMNEIRGALNGNDAITDVVFTVKAADGRTRMLMCSADTDAGGLPEMTFSAVERVQG